MSSQIVKFSSSVKEIQLEEKNNKNVSLIFSNGETLTSMQADCIRKDLSELLGMSCHAILDTQTKSLQLFSQKEGKINYNDVIYNTARTKAVNFGAFEISELFKKIERENDPELIRKVNALPAAIFYCYCEKKTPPFSAEEKRHIEVCSELSHIREAKKDDYSFRKMVEYINELVAKEGSSLSPGQTRINETYDNLDEYLHEIDIVKKLDAIRKHVFGKRRPELIRTTHEGRIVQERRDNYINSPRMKEDEYTIMRIVLPLLRDFNEIMHGRKIIED